MAWLTNWLYRKSHSIGASAGAGTGYQKRIIVHYSNPEDYQHSELADVSDWIRAAGEQNMRTSFYGAGRYWAFYCDNVNIALKTSTDGVNWSSATTIVSGAGMTRLYLFGIYWDETYLHCVWSEHDDPPNDKVYYRRGTPQTNGTINWTSDPVQIFNYTISAPVMAKDSNGKLWLTYARSLGGETGFYVIKNDNTDGTWSTASGYPLKLASVIDDYVVGSICALTNGKMYVAYGHGETNPSKAFGKLFNGSTWGGEETISTYNLTHQSGNSITVDAIGDDVYAVYPVTAVANKARMTFNKRSYGVGWGTEYYISGDLPAGEVLDRSAGPAITFDPTTDELWVYYADSSSDEIFLRKRTSSGWLSQIKIYDFALSIFWVNAFRRPWGGHRAIKFDTHVGASNNAWWITNLGDTEGLNDEDVYVDEKCQADFDDIRFTAVDGETLLDYWLQEKYDLEYAIFWVKVDADLSTEAQTIYVYYDNTEATYPNGADQDEMDATFLFADHFYGSSLNSGKWDLVASPGITVAGSICTVESAGGWRGISSKSSYGPYGIAWISRKKFITGLYSIAGMQNQSDRSDDAMVFWRTADHLTKTDNENVETSKTFTSNDAYRIYEATWKSGECKFYIDDVLGTTHTTNIPNEALKVWIESGPDNLHNSDWVAVRKFVDPEPVHGAWGEEEYEGDEFIAGTVDAQSTTSGALTDLQLLAGTVAVQSTAAVAGMKSLQKIVASLAAVAVIVGAILVPSRILNGCAHIQTAATGTLYEWNHIAGSIAGQSTADADLKGTQKIVGLAEGQSGADATLREWNDIVGSSAGQSTVDAHLTRHDTQLTGSLAVQSTVDATLREWNDIVGTVSVQSTAGAILKSTQKIIGCINVQSAVVGTLFEWNHLVGTVSAQSNVLNAILLRYDTQLVGSLAAEAGADAHLTRHDTQLIGSSDGQATVAATLTRHDTQLVGSLAAQAGADATLREWNDIAGSVVGQSVVSGHLIRYDTQLVGSSAGQSGVDATLRERNEIAGVVTVQSTASAILTSTQLISGVISVQSGSAGTLKEWDDIAGSVTGQSATSGHLTRHDTQLVSGVAAVSGASGVLGTLEEWNALSGTIDAQSNLPNAILLRYDTQLVGFLAAQSTVTATIRERSELVGSISVQSVTSAILTRYDTQLIGALTVQSGADGSLHSTQFMRGYITVQSAVSGTLQEWNDIVGSIAGHATIAAHLTRYDTQLVGSSDGQSTVGAGLKVASKIAGSLAAQSGADATLREWNDIAGSSDGQSTADATLTRYDTQLVGYLDAQSGADATLREWNDIVGSLTAQSEVDAHLTRYDTQLIGSLAVQSTVDADIKGTQKIAGLSEGQSGADATLAEWNNIAGSLVGQSTAVGTLTRHDTQLVGSLIGQSEADAHLIRHDTQLVSGVDAVSGASGVLGTLEEWSNLRGNISVQSSVVGSLHKYSPYGEPPVTPDPFDGEGWGW